jgi:hypothetical protein
MIKKEIENRPKYFKMFDQIKDEQMEKYYITFNIRALEE